MKKPPEARGYIPYNFGSVPLTLSEIQGGRDPGKSRKEKPRPKAADIRYQVQGTCAVSGLWKRHTDREQAVSESQRVAHHFGIAMTLLDQGHALGVRKAWLLNAKTAAGGIIDDFCR